MKVEGSCVFFLIESHILLKPGKGILPGLSGMRFDVALAGIIVEGMINAGIDVYLMGDVGIG